jgi:GntR family transcriptional regulator
MRLMQNSGVPIYQQIADSFKTDILAGRYEQGEFLPSIRGLAKDLKISVITTMKAYEQLADEGLITAAQGKGFYVNAQDSVKFLSFFVIFAASIAFFVVIFIPPDSFSYPY